MPEKRKHIDHRQASIAAAFYEPVYQRLRLSTSPLNLLCFTHETGKTVRDLMDCFGATKSNRLWAGCFAEVWELPDDEHLRAMCDGEPCKLDQRISKALGCVNGRFSSDTGHLAWGDIEHERGRHHFESRLLRESQSKLGRGK